MAYKYLELIGYEPGFLNESHKKESEACMESIMQMQKHHLSPDAMRQQEKRNEELLRTHPRYKSMR